MKKLFSILLMSICISSFSQNKKLFYYVEKDSLLGVKDIHGKVIVPAEYSWNGTISYVNNKTEIKAQIFSVGNNKYFDRKGNFLFKSFMDSEGFYGFEEGFIRYVENHKMGLADKKGTKITPAKYDYISAVNFGYATYCNGCQRDFSVDDEHAPLVGGVWGCVDRNGKDIKLTERRNHPKDIETPNHKFIPYQFRYNKKEQQIVGFFEKRKSEIIRINGWNCSEKKLFFEIVEKPSRFEPYYKIRTFELCGNHASGSDETDDFKNFEVSEDGKKFYVTYSELVNYEKYSEYIKHKIPVDEWIKNNLGAK